MSGVPIANHWRTATLALMAMMVAMAAVPAFARVVVRTADQLSNDPDVKKLEPTYRLLSSANVIYAQCGKELNITEVQQKYLAMLFDTTSKKYLQAYTDAYTDKVGNGAPPTREMTESFVKILTEQQRKEVNKMALFIHQKQGCKNRQLKPIIDYLDSARLAQLQSDAAKAAADQQKAAATAEPTPAPATEADPASAPVPAQP